MKLNNNWSNLKRVHEKYWTDLKNSQSIKKTGFAKWLDKIDIKLLLANIPIP